MTRPVLTSSKRCSTDQPYRLCYWRVATDEINYRRFFDVDSLAAIRVEEPEVFDAVHQMVLRFVDEGCVTGLRIDHADGLLDPRQYLASLSEAAHRRLPSARRPSAEGARLYVVVEKILAHDEMLPDRMADRRHDGLRFLEPLQRHLRRSPRRDMPCATPTPASSAAPIRFADVLYESKRTILATSLSSELYMLSHQLDQISEQHRWSRDFTRPSLYRALREVVACFPVYRTYIRPGTERSERRRSAADHGGCPRGEAAQSGHEPLVFRLHRFGIVVE